MNITINLTDTHIVLNASERLSLPLFKAFRKEGWLSNKDSNLCFKKAESGVVRVARMLAYRFTNVYGLTADDIEEGKAYNFNYENDVVENYFNTEIEKLKAEQAKIKADKEAKAKKADENAEKKYAKINEDLKKMHNGFGTTSHDLFCSGGKLLDAGVYKYVDVSKFMTENEIKSDTIIDGIKLRIELHIQKNNNGDYNYRITTNEYKYGVGEFLSGGTGCYYNNVLLAVVAKRNIKQYIEGSKIITSDIEKIIVENFIKYKNGEIEILKNNGYFEIGNRVENKELENALVEMTEIIQNI